MPKYVWEVSGKLPAGVHIDPGVAGTISVELLRVLKAHDLLDVRGVDFYEHVFGPDAVPIDAETNA